MTETKQPGLHAKIAEVILAVGGVAKDGRNEFHKYDYASAEAILRALRGPLAERGIVLLPSLQGITEREYQTTSRKQSVITTARIRFTFVDTETGAEIVCEWAGTGDDAGDKGLYKAYTGAIKTFLRETFLLPAGDDPEADVRTDERSQQRGTPVSPGPTPATSAPPPQATERIATPKQRNLINAKAAEQGLSKSDLATVVALTSGKHDGEFTDLEAAGRWLNRAMDRLPAGLVDPILQNIKQFTGG